MFTGIIESVKPTLSWQESSYCLRVNIEKPSNFNDLSLGDSIACNGVCLTVEGFDNKSLTFAIGAETLQVTGWAPATVGKALWNLERSLKFGDRIHGHMVSGHADGMSQLLAREEQGDCLLLSFSLPDDLRPYLWKKSSVTLQGVSLTVNQVGNGRVEVCLVPETLKKTNLATIEVGDKVTIEADYYMKGLIAAQKEGLIDAHAN